MLFMASDWHRSDLNSSRLNRHIYSNTSANYWEGKDERVFLPHFGTIIDINKRWNHQYCLICYSCKPLFNFAEEIGIDVILYQAILTEILDMHRFPAKLVPRLLTDYQIDKRVNINQESLDRSINNKNLMTSIIKYFSSKTQILTRRKKVKFSQKPSLSMFKCCFFLKSFNKWQISMFELDVVVVICEHLFCDSSL